MEVDGLGWTATGPDEPWRVVISALDGTAVGAGFVVGTGQVVTCAHVVTAAAPDRVLQGPGPVVVEFPDQPGRSVARAFVADGGWFPPAEGERGDVALLDVERPVPPGPPAPLHRLAATRHRRVRVCGYPKTAGRAGEWVEAAVADPVAGREWVPLDAAPAEPGAGGGFGGAAVVDDGTGRVVGMVVGELGGSGPALSWMLPVESLLRYLPLEACVAGTAAIDPTLVVRGPGLDLPAGAGAGDAGETARRLSAWLAGSGRHPVRLLVTGGPGSAGARTLRRLIVLADRERRPPARHRAVAGAPPGTVPPEGSIDLAIDASGRGVDEIARRIADRLGLAPGAPGGPGPELVGRIGTAAPGMTLAIDGLDDAAAPVALIEELLVPLAERGLRLLLAFRQQASPAWRLAQEHWPDHDREDDDPAVVEKRLDAFAARVAGIATAEDVLLRRRANVARRIAGVPEFPARAMSLRLRLTALRKSHAQRDPAWLGAQLDAGEAAAARSLARIEEFGSALDALLARRAELRDRLEACRARAEAQAAGEDAILLERLYQQAHDTVWRAPCDLTFAADLIDHYRQVVLAREPG
jgi:hypothetical protein